MVGLERKTTIVTGAGSGIGRKTAEVLHAAGASLILTDLHADPLASLSASLDPTGRTVATIVGDVTKPQDNNAVVELCRARYGGLDFLIPAAGIYPEQSVVHMTDQQWRQMMSVNLDGVFYLTRAAIPLMRRGGCIVNVSSMAAHRGSFGRAHYAATKAALLSFTRSLALELAPDIRVNAVSPGFIATETVIGLLGTERSQQLADSVPLRRLGQPEDVAGVIAFLCSSAAAYVTGATIHINGGIYMAS